MAIKFMVKVQGVAKPEIFCYLLNIQIHNSLNCITQEVTDFAAEVGFLCMQM